tara:strand:+ start:16332 stop:16625 length:294 start_codon:yes stop_codon:yes gene_type:complete
LKKLWDRVDAIDLVLEGYLGGRGDLGRYILQCEERRSFSRRKFAGPANDKRDVRSSFIHRVFASPVMKGAEAIGESWARAVFTHEDDGCVLIKIQSL